MCGICGIYNFDNKSVSHQSLKLLNDSMVERGPDSDGFYVKNNFGIAMRRLSIIDLENGQQPIISEDKNIIIIFNGEIYNYIEIKNELKKLGYKFKTNSDTEVILKLYEKKGENFIDELNGMFSICIYDLKKDLILLFRDRIGIKPLYYFKNQNTFIFSSSLKSFKNFFKNINISEENYYLFSLFNHYPHDSTVYSNIKKLLPGCFIKIQKNNFTLHTYWNLKYADEYDYKYSSEKIIEYFLESVDINLRSDVPIATLLSSGMDSSILSYLIQKKNNYQNTFSVDYEKKIENENEKAITFSKIIGSHHKSFDINRSLFFESFDEISKNIDEPNSDSSVVTTYILSKFAKKNNIKVLLSGAGADELFGGYTRYIYNLRNKAFGSAQILKNLKFLTKYLPLKYKNYFHKLSDQKIALLLNNSGQNFSAVISSLKNKKVEHFIDKYINELFSNLDDSFFDLNPKKIMFSDFKNYLPNNILSGFDKATMAASVEGRVPYLDHRIPEIIFNTKLDKFYFSERKKFLVDNFRLKLPKNIFENKKIGFNAPIDIWHLEISKNFFNKTQINDFLINHLDLNYLKKNKNNKNLSQIFYSNYFFNQWLNN